MDVYAEEGLRIHAEMPLSRHAGEKVIVTREPVGVVIAITPFNYPVTLLTFKLGAALIAGCTVVAKPAEDTPLSTLMLAALLHEAGFPAGCFNVVTGRGPGIGMAMVEHPIPRKVAFTGGTAAGKAIAAAAAGTMKRVTLELGGQSPAIVCADADLECAAGGDRAGMASPIPGSSATASIASMCERPVYEAFLAGSRAEAAKLDVGDGLTSALARSDRWSTKRSFATVERQVVDARERGAKIVIGGDRLTGGIFDGGWFFPPTVIADADHPCWS